MTVPQAEIDTFHLRTNFRRILPLGRRRYELRRGEAELRISTRLGEAKPSYVYLRLGEAKPSYVYLRT